MKFKPHDLLRAGRSSIGRQALAYMAFSAVTGVLTAATTALLARELSTEGFGAFALSKSLLLLVASIFEFGIFFPAARLTALSEGGLERRKWLGTILIAYVPLGLLYVATISVLSLGVDSVFNVDAGHALLVTAPLGFAYPFTLVVVSISNGTGRAYLQPLMSAVAGAIVLAGIAALLVTTSEALSLTEVLALRGAAFMVGGITIAVLIRPIFSGFRSRWLKIWTETRSWGMKAYAGRLVAIGTYNLDVLLVGALSDPAQLASYGLALAGASLIGLPAIAMATALFPRMTRHGHLDHRPIVGLLVWGMLATAVGSALAALIIPKYLNPELADAAVLLIPLGLAATAGTVCTVLSTYLNARAAGKELRNTSVILLASNLVLSVPLIALFDAMGAAVASFLSMLVTSVSYFYYVRRLGPPTSDLMQSGGGKGSESS